MATEKLITTETVARTEKKMDMSLDEIIKMEKTNTNVNTNVNKGKKHRASNKKEKFNGGAARNSAVKAQRYMDSRSDVRQGAFAKRRSNFQGNQFPVTTSIAHKATYATPRGRPYNAGRMTYTNQSRFITPPAQNRFVQRGFIAKQHQQQHREKIEQKQTIGAGGGGQRQWPQTLDSRFASMKEERMRMRRFADSRSNVGGNNGAGLQQQQQRSMVPWARRATRFPN